MQKQYRAGIRWASDFVAVGRVFTIALFASLATLVLPATSALSAGFECVERPAEFEPPPFAPPRLLTIEGEQRKALEQPLMKPVCGEGLVPVFERTEPRVLKGNPLLGPAAEIDYDTPFDPSNVKGEQVLSSVLSFESVYQPTDGREVSPEPNGFLPPDPDGDCRGRDRPSACYYYAGAGDRREADGGGMTFSIERPFYSSTGGGGHTLAEISVQGGPGDGNIVELGWNVSTSQYGDPDPHLFVFHWIGWEPTCYDGCGWQQYSSTYAPGMNLSALVDSVVYMGYLHWEGNWWAWFNGEWLGYFPGSEWGDEYQKSELIQWFGEVATNNPAPPGVHMGNGARTLAPSAATMSTLCDVDVVDYVCRYRDEQFLNETLPEYYEIDRVAFGATRYGGPGCGYGYEAALIIPVVTVLGARRRRSVGSK